MHCLIKCWDWTFSKSKDLIFPNTSDNYIISCFQDAMMCEGILGKILLSGIFFSSSLCFTTATATACSKFETSVSPFHFLFLISLPSRPGLVPWWKTGYKCKYGRGLKTSTSSSPSTSSPSWVGKECKYGWVQGKSRWDLSAGAAGLFAWFYPQAYFRAHISGGVAFMVQRKGGKSGKSAPGNW